MKHSIVPRPVAGIDSFDHRYDNPQQPQAHFGFGNPHDLFAQFFGGGGAIACFTAPILLRRHSLP